MTAEEIKQLTQEEMKTIVVETSKVIKQYIDENTISPEQVEELERANKLAESLLGLFDSNEDGAITLDEFVQKLDEIYATLSSVKELKDQILNIAKDLGALVGRVDAIESNLTENYLTKSDVESILTIDTDSIIGEVRNVFFPETVADSDGAVE
jgi:predicted transcriptional regulator